MSRSFAFVACHAASMEALGSIPRMNPKTSIALLETCETRFALESANRSNLSLSQERNLW